MLQPGADLTTESKTPIYNNICLIEMSRSMSSGKVRLLHANKWYQTKLIRSGLKVDSILRQRDSSTRLLPVEGSTLASLSTVFNTTIAYHCLQGQGMNTCCID